MPKAHYVIGYSRSPDIQLLRMPKVLAGSIGRELFEFGPRVGPSGRSVRSRWLHKNFEIFLLNSQKAQTAKSKPQ